MGTAFLLEKRLRRYLQNAFFYMTNFHVEEDREDLIIYITRRLIYNISLNLEKEKF